MQFEADPSRYTVERLIGQGASGFVFGGTYNSDQGKVPVAIKTINLDKASQNIEQLQQETKLLAMCHHPNVCPLYQSMVHQQYLWLVMPELQVSLIDLLKTLQPVGFDESIIATLMHDVLQAISYLHQNGQIHRDIKLSNLLMDAQGNTLVSDFGVAGIIRPFSNEIRSTFVGSPLYMAPEVANNKPYNQAADIWSFGICLYQLSHGSLPHENCQAMEALLRVIQQEPPRISQKRSFSKQFKELIEACLIKNPAERLTAQQLLQLKFWQKKADKSNLIDMLREYQVMRQPKPGAFQDQVQTANNILQSRQAQLMQQSQWDFNTDETQEQEIQPDNQTTNQTSPQKDTTIEQEKSAPDAFWNVQKTEQEIVTQSPKPLESQEDATVRAVMKMAEEIRELRMENRTLKEENQKYKDRLKLFMNQQEQ